jgi:hypothetical protein
MRCLLLLLVAVACDSSGERPPADLAADFAVGDLAEATDLQAPDLLESCPAGGPPATCVGGPACDLGWACHPQLSFTQVDGGFLSSGLIRMCMPFTPNVDPYGHECCGSMYCIWTGGEFYTCGSNNDCNYHSP